MDQWIDENIERIDFEDLLELDRKIKQHFYITACSFGAAVIIQQSVIRNPNYLSESKGLLRIFKGSFWILFPFITGYYGYTTGAKRRDSYVRKLINKYDEIDFDPDEETNNETNDDTRNNKSN
ncbi:unnamed protein product [Blepharisma stoltei]|uniref:Uncharacterized protein n=1 Tax=Blepharisma stoltei TaxID=1481888 RepID=A0AAU9IPW4_9CILI|nr:unnamed protein product [Blepharisma stoltei]